VVAIGSVSEGFILCDEHDRVVLFNERYRELHPPQATVLREGVTFAELAREAVRRGGVAVLDGDAESWVERCVETHRNPGDPFESRLSNGTWLKISERRTASELDSGASGRKRFERRRPNGTVIEITFDPMPDGGFIKTYADITERVRAEEERTRLLEEEVEERTRQLRQEVKEREDAQAQLAQSQKVESVGQLTGGVAHDFNNLLTAVIGNLDLLDRHVTSGAGRKLLRGASRAAERGASLTQRLLAFARRQRLEPQ